MQENSFGFAHLWASGDSISHAVAIILAIMSVISWYLILAKAVDWWAMRRAAKALGTFWSASSVSDGIALLNPDVYDQLRFWQAGSLDIRTLQTLKTVLVPVLVAGIVALMMSRSLNSLSLGTDTATAPPRIIRL